MNTSIIHLYSTSPTCSIIRHEGSGGPSLHPQDQSDSYPRRHFDCKFVSTPRDRTIKLRPDSGQVCDPMSFRQIVGSLICFTIGRPNLSYPVGVISQCMARPTEEHLQCAQRVLRCVSGTKDRGLLYRTGTTTQLVGYTDVDWANNDVDYRSTSGYAFSLGSAAIAWNSKNN